MCAEISNEFFFVVVILPFSNNIQMNQHAWGTDFFAIFPIFKACINDNIQTNYACGFCFLRFIHIFFQACINNNIQTNHACGIHIFTVFPIFSSILITKRKSIIRRKQKTFRIHYAVIFRTKFTIHNMLPIAQNSLPSLANRPLVVLGGGICWCIPQKVHLYGCGGRKCCLQCSPTPRTFSQHID